MNNIQHILFDTDGVLVHAEPWSLRVAREYWISADMQTFFRGIFQDCLLGNADLKQILPPYLYQWWWNDGVESYLKHWFDSENLPDRELIVEIQKLRKSGIQCHVATNQEKYRLAYLRHEMRFAHDFDGVFCSAEMWVKKPQKEFFLQILEILQVEVASEVLYFDDSPENIKVAQSLGIRGVVYNHISDFTSIIR